MVKKYSDKQKAKVRILRKKGYTYERIEKKTKVKASSLFYIIKNDSKGYDNFQETIINKLNFESLIQNSRGKNEKQIKRVLKKQIKSLAEENNHLVPETKQSSKKRRIIEQIVDIAMTILAQIVEVKHKGNESRKEQLIKKQNLKSERQNSNLQEKNVNKDQLDEEKEFAENQVYQKNQEEYSEDLYSPNNQVFQKEGMKKELKEQTFNVDQFYKKLNLGEEKQFCDNQIVDDLQIQEYDQYSQIYLPKYPKSRPTQHDDPSRE